MTELFLIMLLCLCKFRDTYPHALQNEFMPPWIWWVYYAKKKCCQLIFQVANNNG